MRRSKISFLIWLQFSPSYCCSMCQSNQLPSLYIRVAESEFVSTSTSRLSSPCELAFVRVPHSHSSSNFGIETILEIALPGWILAHIGNRQNKYMQTKFFYWLKTQVSYTLFLIVWTIVQLRLWCFTPSKCKMLDRLEAESGSWRRTTGSDGEIYLSNLFYSGWLLEENKLAWWTSLIVASYASRLTARSWATPIQLNFHWPASYTIRKPTWFVFENGIHPSCQLSSALL